jgi:hypothetical protein
VFLFGGEAALAQPQAPRWLILPPQTDLGPEAGSAIQVSVIDALTGAGQDVVPVDLTAKVLAVAGVPVAKLAPADVAEIAGGVNATRALMIEVAKKGPGRVAYVVRRVMATGEVTVKEGEVGRVAMLKQLRGDVLELAAAPVAAPAPPAAPRSPAPAASRPPAPTQPARPTAERSSPQAVSPEPLGGAASRPETGAPAAPVGGEAPVIVTTAAWLPTLAPGGPGTVVYGRGFNLAFGVSPGTVAKDGLGSGTTGITNFGGGMQLGFGGFATGSMAMYEDDDVASRYVQGRARFGLTASRADQSGTTVSSYAVALSLESLDAEYLHYLGGPPDAAPFVGAWGSLTGARVDFVGTPADPSTTPPTAASTSKTITLPLRVSVGGGFGRVYPIQGRITLGRFVRVLQDDGVLAGEPSPEVSQRILALWYHERDTLKLPPDPSLPYGASHQVQLLGALQVLAEAGLLRGPVGPFTSYRLGRVLTDEGSIDRWYGREVRAGLRVGEDVSVQTGSDTQKQLSLALEVTGRQYFNLTLDSDLRIEPALGIALRSEDEPANDLRGHTRVILGAAPDRTSATAFIPTGRLVLDVPVSYLRYVHDEGLNLAGFWRVHGGAAVGYGSGLPPVGSSTNSTTPVAAPSGAFAFGATAGASYTLFTRSQTGYTFGLEAGLGVAGGSFAYAVNLVLAVGLGTGDSFYSAPDQVGDTTPFDSSWLPVPSEQGDQP